MHVMNHHNACVHEIGSPFHQHCSTAGLYAVVLPPRLLIAGVLLQLLTVSGCVRMRGQDSIRLVLLPQLVVAAFFASRGGKACVELERA